MNDRAALQRRLPSIDEEVTFSFEDLFFSRTDGKGRISSGNIVFQRVSGFHWEELLGRPHNIVRHPDVPRAVFWLLWERLKKGMATGAYVKNKAKDGRYYWVYAIITPIDGGYLSVRLKPGSEIFSIIPAEYARLAEAEAVERLTPSQSAERLLQRLSELGFSTYDAFMGVCLTHETINRNKCLGRTTPAAVLLYDQLMSISRRLLDAATAIVTSYQLYRFVPLNLTVQASRLGEPGKAISTISHNYEALSEQIRLGLDEFMLAAQRVSQTIHEGAFLLATSEAQDEIARFFEREVPTPQIDHALEAAYLTAQRDLFHRDAIATIFCVRNEVRIFSENVFEIKRLGSGLAAIRVMGKVEAGRLDTAVLSELLKDLEAFQEVLQKGLERIVDLSGSVDFSVTQLLVAGMAKESSLPLSAEDAGAATSHP